MVSSRSLQDLHPFVCAVAVGFIARAEMELSCKLLVTCTLRDEETQNALYAQGRTAPGKIVTNARGGESAHQYGLALDVVPIVNGKPVWDATAQIWQEIGRIGKELGFEWAGDWIHFTEEPHFQMLCGLTIKDLQNGIIPNFEQHQ